MKVIMFNNPSCSKCRQARIQLETSSCEIESIEYLTDPPTTKELKNVLELLGIPAVELVRKKEPLYSEKFAGKKFTNAEWIKIMSKNPVLIQRPILISGNRAIIGRDEQKLKEWLKVPMKKK